MSRASRVFMSLIGLRIHVFGTQAAAVTLKVRRMSQLSPVLPQASYIFTGLYHFRECGYFLEGSVFASGALHVIHRTICRKYSFLVHNNYIFP